MAEQIDKKQPNSSSGYFLVIAGVVGVATRFIGGFSFGTVSLIKFGLAIVVLVYGLILILRKK